MDPVLVPFRTRLRTRQPTWHNAFNSLGSVHVPETSNTKIQMARIVSESLPNTDLVHMLGCNHAIQLTDKKSKYLTIVQTSTRWMDGCGEEKA